MLKPINTVAFKNIPENNKIRFITLNDEEIFLQNKSNPVESTYFTPVYVYLSQK